MKISISRRTITNNFFLIINLLCLGLKIVGNTHIGVITSLVIIAFLVLNTDTISIFNKDVVFALFILVNVFSVLAYIYNDRSINIYIKGISYNLVPSLIYLLGAKSAKSNNDEKLVANKILFSALVLMCIGLFFYIALPDYFYSHIGQDLDTYRWGINDYRYGSYISSSNLGSLCVACIPLFFLTINDRNGIKNCFVFLLIIISLFLCMQRSAWVVTVALLFAIIVKSRLEKPKKILIMLGILLLIIAYFLFADVFLSSAQLSYFQTRSSQINIITMISERINQWQGSFQIFISNPIGYGLGSMGHKAAEAGYTDVVADGNYIRILGELGIEGLVLFVCLIFKAVKNGIKKHLELTLLIFGFCLQAIGTNVFDLYYSSFVFWFVLGYLNHTSDAHNMTYASEFYRTNAAME